MLAIESLMEKRGKFDYILLETSGLADPGKAALFSYELLVQSSVFRSHCYYVLARRRY